MAHKRKHRRGRKNPVGGLTGSLKAGFNSAAIKDAALLTGGMVANAYVSGMVRQYIPGGYGANPVVGAAAGLATAGLLGMVASKVKGGAGRMVFLGGMAQSVGSLVAYYMPSLRMMGRMLGDALTMRQAANARPLMSGMNDFLTTRKTARALPIMRGINDMGDYMTVRGSQDRLPIHGSGDVLVDEYQGAAL